MEDLEIVSGEDRSEAVVVVLVDEEHAKPAVRLAIEGGEEPLGLVDAVDGRDDEIEGRELRRRHRP